MNNRSPRNKTLTLTPEEEAGYLGRCLTPSVPLTEAEARDSTICADCVNALSLLPRGSYGLMIADPPYNMDKSFGGTRFHRMTDELYAEFTESWLEKALPLLAENASVYVCCDWSCSRVIEGVLSKYLTIRNRITWQREKGRGAERNWKNSSEDIWFATKSDDYVFNKAAVMQRRRVMAPYREDGQPKDWNDGPRGRFRDSAPSNFWDDITVPYWSMAENTDHPTQKSEKLLAKLILASSNPGDSVLDPFGGSGSVSVACKKLGRHYTGIEINPEYCAWAEKRLETAARDSSIQGYADGVFWERNTSSLQKHR